MDYDVGLLHDYMPADLVILDRHNPYMVSDESGEASHCVAYGTMRHSSNSLMSLSIRTVRFQTARYNKVTRDLRGSIHSELCWGFEGCFSLFEASVALVTGLAQ